MHTVIVLSVGLALVLACIGIGAAIGGRPGAARGALVSVPLWFLGALGNLVVGTTHGYTVSEEAPIFVVVFAIPAIPALLVWFRLPHAPPTPVGDS